LSCMHAMCDASLISHEARGPAAMFATGTCAHHGIDERWDPNIRIFTDAKSCMVSE